MSNPRLERVKNKSNSDLLRNSISLKDAIRLVHEELISSQKEREDSNIQPLFQVDRLTIEANCVFTKKENSDVEFEVKLLSLFSVKSRLADVDENSFVQKIKLELKAIDNNDLGEGGVLPSDVVFVKPKR